MSGIDDVRVGKVRAAREGESLRVLVDRLWPRGVSKESADLDLWPKDITPSTHLRKTFHAGDLTFLEFEAAYREELARPEAQPMLDELVAAVMAAQGAVVLLIAGNPDGDNHAQVLRRYLAERMDAADD